MNRPVRWASAARILDENGYAVLPLPSLMHDLMLSCSNASLQVLRRIILDAAGSRAASLPLVSMIPSMTGFIASSAITNAGMLVRNAVCEAETQTLRTLRELPGRGDPSLWRASVSDFSVRVGSESPGRSRLRIDGASLGTTQSGDQRQYALRVPLDFIQESSQRTPRFTCWPQSIGRGVHERHGPALTEDVMRIERCGDPIDVDVPIGCIIIYAADLVHTGWSNSGMDPQNMCWIQGCVRA